MAQGKRPQGKRGISVKYGWSGGGTRTMLNGSGPGTPIKKKTKLGRNDPCYCGSGKKYKKCCKTHNG